MVGHASAAMTLDTYADLFDADLDTVAESVGKMWASVVNSSWCSTPNGSPPAAM
jgi:hypothetical protein